MTGPGWRLPARRSAIAAVVPRRAGCCRPYPGDARWPLTVVGGCLARDRRHLAQPQPCQGSVCRFDRGDYLEAAAPLSDPLWRWSVVLTPPKNVGRRGRRRLRLGRQPRGSVQPRHRLRAQGGKLESAARDLPYRAPASLRPPIAKLDARYREQVLRQLLRFAAGRHTEARKARKGEERESRKKSRRRRSSPEGARLKKQDGRRPAVAGAHRTARAAAILRSGSGCARDELPTHQRVYCRRKPGAAGGVEEARHERSGERPALVLNAHASDSALGRADVRIERWPSIAPIPTRASMSRRLLSLD
jgi:hypothetical protein